MPDYTTFDEYLATCPEDVRAKLREMHAIIKAAAPEAKETIAWAMPTFTQNGYVVHFAAGKRHIGLYPGASGVAAFPERLTEYHTSKGAIQFPLDKELPAELISDIVRFRVRQNDENAKEKAAAKQAEREARAAARAAAKAETQAAASD